LGPVERTRSVALGVICAGAAFGQLGAQVKAGLAGHQVLRKNMRSLAEFAHNLDLCAVNEEAGSFCRDNRRPQIFSANSTRRINDKEEPIYTSGFRHNRRYSNALMVS